MVTLGPDQPEVDHLRATPGGTLGFLCHLSQERESCGMTCWLCRARPSRDLECSDPQTFGRTSHTALSSCLGLGDSGAHHTCWAVHVPATLSVVQIQSPQASLDQNV